MSDVMLFGVLQMPFDMAMGDDLSRYQYWQRGQEACARLSTLEQQLSEAVAQNEALRDALWYYHDHCTGAEPSLSVFCRKLDNALNQPAPAALSALRRKHLEEAAKVCFEIDAFVSDWPVLKRAAAAIRKLAEEQG